MRVVRTVSDAEKIENLENVPPGLAEDVLELFEGIHKSRSDEEERLEDFELDPGRGGFVAVLTGDDFDNDLGSKVREVGLNSAGDLTSFVEFVERLHCPDTCSVYYRAAYVLTNDSVTTLFFTREAVSNRDLLLARIEERVRYDEQYSDHDSDEEVPF